MSWIYTEADYHGIVDDAYQRYPYVDIRANLLGTRWQPYINNTILIAGAGFGYSIESLMTMTPAFGDVWGIEASDYAVNVAAPQEIPNHVHRLIQGDVTVRQNMNAVRSAAGLQGNQRFRATLTENLLPCAESISEAQTMLTELRRATQDMAHIITPAGASHTQMPGFLWLTFAEWRQVIGPGEPIISTIDYQVIE